jgi:hypothetical protein
MTPLRVLSGLCAAAAARGSRSSGGGGGAVAPWHRLPLAPPAAAPPQVGQASRGAAARAIAWSQHVWQQVGALLGCAIWGIEISSTSLAPCEGRGRPLAGGWLLLRCCVRCMLLLHAAAAGWLPLLPARAAMGRSCTQAWPPSSIILGIIVF